MILESGEKAEDRRREEFASGVDIATPIEIADRVTAIDRPRGAAPLRRDDEMRRQNATAVSQGRHFDRNDMQECFDYILFFG